MNIVKEIKDSSQSIAIEVKVDNEYLVIFMNDICCYLNKYEAVELLDKVDFYMMENPNYMDRKQRGFLFELLIKVNERPLRLSLIRDEHRQMACVLQQYINTGELPND